MPHIAVHPAQSFASLPEKAQDHLATALALVRERAYEIFQFRGAEPGHEVDDWLTAERELFDLPETSVQEQDGELRIEFPVEGFQAEDLEVEVLPDAVLIHGQTETKSLRSQDGAEFEEFRRMNLFRKVPLAEPIDPDQVTANLDDGVLRLIARKGAARESGLKARAAQAGD